MALMISVDFSLLEVEMELETLEQHLQLIEEQIQRRECQLEHKRKLDTKELCLDDDDHAAQWDFINQEFRFQIEFVLPHVLRSPFLVSLFSVYETSVTRIAELM